MNQIKKLSPSFSLNDIEYTSPQKFSDGLTICIVGVFSNKSSSSHFLCKAFETLSSVREVVIYDYREQLSDPYNSIISDFIEISKDVDIMIIMKGNDIPTKAIQEASENCCVMMWMMDIYSHFYNSNLLQNSYHCGFRVATGYGTSVDWASSIGLPVYHIFDGSDSDTYYPTMEEKIYDVSFIGTRDNERNNILKSIKQNENINVKFFGPKFTEFVKPDKFREICNKSKIVLNVSRGNIAGYSSLRLWNLLACGSLVITKRIPYMSDLVGLRETHDIVSFSNLDDLNNKITYYLKNDGERENIARNGLNFVRSYRTWRHTAQNLMYIIENEEQAKLNERFTIGKEINIKYFPKNVGKKLKEIKKRL